ncbi:sodium:solute symporter family protein [Pseudovibrio sp. Tun.PSC04-5.I4]|uniref:sodium:solute symporter family protein n=1 Tax=Pseudovibrio sp. Tun.PSC04-5.I4 TaxID=1798213 RepID=UPI000882D593|nr:sodium:solute symporter family protein [Pseudovibrio sp. Tun.PSC04-5.I4]SDR33292.1 solute:Na+ symporter, SSS family [Pseudovibrio sp. Tun.PSC04-5.I4]
MIDMFIVAGYLVAILIVGLWGGRVQKGLKDYATAGREFGSLVIFATMSASFIGGGFSTGNAEKVFIYGIANIVALWGFSFKEILVAVYIAPKMDVFPSAVSVGDVMSAAYGKVARIITGVCGVMLCCGIVGAQVGAIGVVFNVFFGLDRYWGIVIGCGTVIIYTTLGGMRAVVYTDVVQFVILAIGMPLVLIFGVYHVGGLEALYNAVPADRLTLPGPDFGWIGLIGLILVFMFGETLVPPYMQRLLAGKTAKAAARGTLYSGLFSFLFFAITGAIGLVALAMAPDLNPNNAMPYVIMMVLPPVLKGLVFSGVIAIVMSSADSYLNSASIAFVNDIVLPLRSRAIKEETLLFIAKIVTLCVGLLSILFAVSIESILDILIYAYNYWAPILLVPLVSAIYGLRKGTVPFLGGAVAGVLVTLLWQTVLDSPGEIPGLVIGVLVNLLVFCLVPKSSIWIKEQTE